MSAAGAAAPRLMRGALRFWNTELSNVRGEMLAMTLLVPLLLLPVIWNRFPIIYYDTGAYLFEGLTGRFIPERSAVYSLFLRFADAATSLWIVVLLQAVMSAFLLVQCARAVVPAMRCGVLVVIAAALAVATALPWYIGEVEPDCFTALLALAVYLLAFHATALGRWRGIVVVLIGTLAAAVHPSHLLLAGFLLAVLLVWRVVQLFRPALNGRRPNLLAPMIVGATGLVLVFAGNFDFTRQLFFSRAGAPFLFARMLQDGIVMRLLDDTCPQSGYRLCAYKEELPRTADAWLWTPHSPFFSLGHFKGTEAESARIVRDALVRYPLLQLRAAVSDSSLQFVRFRTGDQIEPQEWVLAPVLAHLIPRQMTAYLTARQQEGAINFRPISTLHVVVGYLSLAGLIALLVWSIGTTGLSDAALPAFVLATLVGNAIICGTLSGPHDRYQSRLMWLASFAVAVAITANRKARTVE